MSDPEEVPLVTLNEYSPYYNFFTEPGTEKIINFEHEDSLYNYLFDQEQYSDTNDIDVNENIQQYSLEISFEEKQIPSERYEPYDKEKIQKKFDIKILEWTGKTLSDWFKNLRQVQPNMWLIVKKEADAVVNIRDLEKSYKETQASQASQDSQDSQAPTAHNSLATYDGVNYLARGGVGGSLVRRISASINNARARQTHENVNPDNFNLYRSFFLIIWEHFAPNSNIRERPRRRDPTPLNARLPPMYSRYGNRVCSVLLRCVRRVNNIAYSVLFEFTNNIHWSIFYSFDVNARDSGYIDRSGQVSELHFTLNEDALNGIPKTRMFFEYTPYINDLIRNVHEAMVERGLHISSSKQQQGKIMEIVSELMLLTMYQLVTAESYTSGGILSSGALTMRQNIDSLGAIYPDNQLLNIALRHVDLIDCIQQEFRSHPRENFASDGFINHLQTDISRAITAVATTAAPAGAAAGPAIPGGGKNINKYLTKINNIKERLKLLKKNKVKNKVKITKLNKSIEELKAKLKKQKEKEKAKLKKQKEKEKAKLKKQKEKEKAKLKKQKEKEKAKRKKTKAKKT